MKPRKTKHQPLLSLDELKQAHIECAIHIGERIAQIHLCREEIKKMTAKMIDLGTLAKEIQGDSN